MSRGNSNNNRPSDYFTSEFDINSAPITARNLLTKGFIQDEINQCSGAAISTRGRYIGKNDHPKNPNDRPLYLFIQGSTEQSIELAVQKINDIIRSDLHNPSGSLMNNNQNPLNRQMIPPNINSKLTPANNATHIDKVFVGLDGAPAAFDLRGKIIGQGGSNLQYIRTETGAAITLRGRGSQFVDPQLGRESAEPLHLYIEHPRPNGLAAARSLVVNLIDTLIQELQQTTDFQVPPPQQNVPNNQIFDYPPQMVSAPPMTIPPPTQQQFTIPMQHQQPTAGEQQMLIGTNSNGVQTQIHLVQNQVPNINQITQAQQIVLQQPPPMIRPPSVSIPPPGIHIPQQHTAAMVNVPPPQIVQLSAPPPNVSGSGNVLVVGHNPNQSLYIPEMASSSSTSMATLLFDQGGVLYHQAPPVQTQAQIGDGLHIITTPSQQMSEMSSFVHPQTQMIITQVQSDADQQFHQPKPQYHVIGHVQTAQISQDHDEAPIQQHQHIMHSQETDGFPHFNQPPASSGQMVYQMNLPAGNPQITTIAVSQNDLQQLNVIQAQQKNMMKPLPNQIPHSQHQMIDRNQLPIAQIPNMQQEQIVQAQLSNGPNIFTQMPPNQILMEQMPNSNGQIIATPVGNQIIQHQQQPNQFVLQPQQQQQQFPHQFLLQQHPQQISPPSNPPQMQQPQLMPNVNYQNQFIQQQQQQLFEPQTSQQGEMRRAENQQRNRNNNRNRRNQRNNRQNPYPWKNEEKPKYPYSDNQSWKNNKKGEEQTHRYQNDGEDDRNFKYNMNPANQGNFQGPNNNNMGSWNMKAEGMQKKMDNPAPVGFPPDFQPPGSQNAGRLNINFAQPEPPRGDKRLSSPGTKWSDLSGEQMMRNTEKGDNVMMKDPGQKGSPNVRFNPEDGPNDRFSEQRIGQFQSMSDKDSDGNMPYHLPPPPPPPQRFNNGAQFDGMYQNQQNMMNVAPPTMIPSMVPPPSIPPNRSQQPAMSQQASYPYWMNH